METKSYLLAAGPVSEHEIPPSIPSAAFCSVRNLNCAQSSGWVVLGRISVFLFCLPLNKPKPKGLGFFTGTPIAGKQMATGPPAQSVSRASL